MAPALDDDKIDSFPIRFYLTQLYLNTADLAAARALMPQIQAEMTRLDRRADREQFDSLRRSVDLMHARLLIGEGDYAQALPLLERVAAGEPDTAEQAAEHFQALRLRGAYHEQTGCPDLAAQCYDNAAQIARTRRDQAAARLNAARAWELAGATERAIADCRRAATLVPDPDSYLLLANLLLAWQQMLPAAARDWGDFDAAMTRLREWDQAGRLQPPWPATLLELEANLVRASAAGGADSAIEQARQTARELEDRFPTDPVLMRRLVLLYENLQRPADADRALARFQELETDDTARRLVESNLLFGRQQYAAARACLPELDADLKRADRVAVGEARAQIALAEENATEAAEILGQLAEQYPDDLSIVRLRMIAASRMGDDDAGEELETELLSRGRQDQSWAGVMRIRRLVAESATASDAGFLEAVSLLARLEAARPAWSVVFTLRGEIEEKRASFVADENDQRIILERAARAYQQAVDLGDRSLAVQERLINTLYRVGRFDEARTYLARIENVVPVSGRLSQVAINLAVRDERPDQALELRDAASRAARTT